MLEFKDLEIGQSFKIPFCLDHEMEEFVKLPFNKAILKETGQIFHFADMSTVWIFE